jgi:hypothetical protein
VLSSPLVDGGTVVVGTPCVLDEEMDPMFDGFGVEEVDVEAVPQETSGAAVCLGYHFQGLATCPYGQSADGGGPNGKSCSTTGGEPVVGPVAPQCVNRRPLDTVFWSCRCANAAGHTDDGAGYCDCPSSTTCTQAIAAVGTTGSGLAGAYCVPTSAVVAPTAACSAECDPAAHPCN